MQIKNVHKVAKKNKKITKNKVAPLSIQNKSKTTKTNFAKDVVRQFSKIVNSKKS